MVNNDNKNSTLYLGDTYTESYISKLERKVAIYEKWLTYIASENVAGHCNCEGMEEAARTALKNAKELDK